MEKRTFRIVGIAAVLVSAAVGSYYYPQLPARMATHWNASGEVDGTMSTLPGVFLFTFLVAGIAVLFDVLPRIDPRRRDVAGFDDTYWTFAAFMLGFLLYVQALVILWNLDVRFDLTRALIPALAVLYYAIGVLVERAKPNWFVGIRTPWTLSDDRVWQRTHERTATLFKLCGLLALVGLAVPAEYAVYFVVGPVLLVSAYAVAYSYLEFRRATA